MKVSKRFRCPICGHEDWCMVWEKKDNPTMHSVLCNRHQSDSLGTRLLGADGKEYVCWSITSEQKSIYEPVAYSERFGKRKASSAYPARTAVQAVVREEPVKEYMRPLRDLDRAYRTILKFSPLNKEHEKYLEQEGISAAMQKEWLLGSLPDVWARKAMEEELVRLFGTPNGIPGIAKKDGKWRLIAPTGILFPVFNAEGYIVRLRIRVDRPCVCEGKYYTQAEAKALEAAGKEVEYRGKYRYISTAPSEKYSDGCSSGTVAGIYFDDSCRLNTAWIIEGEKKCMLWKEICQDICICLPGVTNLQGLFSAGEGETPLVDVLWNAGVNQLVIAFDSDKHTNEMVLKAEQTAINRLKSQGFRILVANWDMAKGKGIDDFALTCRREGKNPMRELQYVPA